MQNEQMKSKVTTYVLLLAVLAIWGAIVRKMVQREDEPPQSGQSSEVVEAPPRVVDTLRLDYRDPFLGRAPEPRPAVRVGAAKPMASTPPPRPPINTHHTLSFMGNITRGGTVYCLVSVNGAMHSARKGEIVEGYRVGGVWNDSVRLERDGELITVKINR